MGLAASQARFLGLTARKSNIEFQGQQINQARTSLSNEIMDLYSKYQKLNVPVAPSVNDFIETTYTLSSTPEKYEMNNISKIASGEYEGYYNIDLIYDVDVPIVYPRVLKKPSITATKEEDGLSKLNITIGSTTYFYDGTDKSTITKITKDDYNKYSDLLTIMEDKKYPDGTVFFMFRENDVNYYTTEDTILTSAFIWDENGNGKFDGNSYTFDYRGNKPVEKSISAIGALSQASSGRWSSVQVVKCDDDPSLVSHIYSITVGSENNEAAYADAMNQYNYENELYKREVELINKKTEKIQAEDKSLEMKLSQLDTEQNAIKTEMDSISKVIEDTIKTVFESSNS